MPPSYASVLPLTTDFNETGTAFYREKTSKLSLLKTPEENTRAQGAMNPHYNGRLHPHLDVLEEFPDYTVAADGEGEGRMGVGLGGEADDGGEGRYIRGRRGGTRRRPAAAHGRPAGAAQGEAAGEGAMDGG